MTGWYAFAALWALGIILWYPIMEDTLSVPVPFLGALVWPVLGLYAIGMWAVMNIRDMAIALRAWWWEGKNEKAPPKERPIDSEEG